MFSVKDTLQLEVLQEAHLLSGRRSLAISPVESVSVIEMPVEDFVRKNEFVLTTGIGCGEDTEVFKQFVSDIMAGSAACLGIATGRHIQEIPEDVVAFAEDCGFPVIQIPWKIRFSDIIKELLTEMNSRQRLLLRQADTLQQELLSLVLNSADLSAIAKFVEQQTNVPVIIVNRRGMIAGQSLRADHLAQHWQQDTEVGPGVHPLPNPSPLPIAIEPIVQRVGPLRILKVPVRSASEVQGYLVMIIPHELPVDAFLPLERAHLLEHAAAAAALCFLRANLREQTEIRLRHDVLWKLIRGEEQSDESILAQSRLLNYDISQSHVCMIAAFENLDFLFGQGDYEMTQDNWIDNILDKLEAVFADTAAMEQIHVLTAVQRRQIVCFFGIGPFEDNYKLFNGFVTELEQNAQDLLPGVIISWGIGEPHEGLKSFHVAYKEARAALEVGNQKRHPGHRTHFTDVGFHRALLRLAEDEDMKSLANQVLGKLLAYDTQKGMDLKETLRVYLRYQGNVSQTSRQLNLHRQTLMYRLRRIESLTGRSLVDPDDLFLLDLTLRITESVRTTEVDTP